MRANRSANVYSPIPLLYPAPRQTDYCYLLLDSVEYLLVKLPIVIEVNAVIVMQPNDIDVIVSFGQTTERYRVVASR